jgi:DNA methylase
VAVVTKIQPRRRVANQNASLATLEQSRLNIENRLRTSRLAWRGQFSPELIEYLIATLCPDSKSFLDPFCGSGTVLYEAVQRGHAAVGYEVNPAAWHLASLSTFGRLEPAEKKRVITELRQTAAAFCLPSGDLFGGASAPSKFLELVEHRCGDQPVARALAAAVLIGMGDTNDLTRAAITKGTSAVLTLLGELAASNGKADCFLTDPRRPLVKSESIEAVITSPPYINVFNYHQNYRPAVELLGWRPLEAARSEIGANRKHRQNRFLTVIQYCLDMAHCIETTATSLKQGAPLIIVLGRTSNVLGASFLNSEIIRSLLDLSEAFAPVKVAERVFTNRFGAQIYEDILYTSREGWPVINDVEVRAIASKALSRALKIVPERNRLTLQKAIEAACYVQPSPYLGITVPRAFAKTNLGTDKTHANN